MKPAKNLFKTLFFSFSHNIFYQIALFFVIEWLAFHKIFSFWFYHGWEASWLIGNTGGVFTLRTLMRSHGFISALNLVLFGWNPQKWFATAFLLHFLVTVALFLTVKKISKNTLIAFVVGLVFVATTADHDVITWGSFESLYAAQTLGFFIMFFLYIRFRQTKKKIFYIFSLLFFAIAGVLRESGLLFIPLLFFFEILFYQNKLLIEVRHKKIVKKSLIYLIALMIPFWVLGVIYLILRASYGGSPYDYIDQRVQLRILLMHEHRFGEYIWYGLLAFGQYLPPYIIPYPVLNIIKTRVYTLIPLDFINNYFFVIWGWIIYICFIIVLFIQRKGKYFKYLLFLLSMFSLITIFYSFAWTTDETFLSLPYSWSENRWRYFAFTALSPFLVISFFAFYTYLNRVYKKTKVLKTLFFSTIVFSVIINIFFLNTIEEEMYWENHAVSIQFYKTLTKLLPNLNSQTRFFYYRNAEVSLNDFLAEFYYIKQSFYPKMKTLPTDWVRSQMYYIVKYLSLGTFPKTNFYFLDWSPAKGVLDRTQDVKIAFRNQKTIDLTKDITTTESGSYTAQITNSSSVEFPYLVTIQAALNPIKIASVSGTTSLNDKEFASILSFMPDEVSFMQNTKVSVCKTMDNQVNEEFHNFTPANIIDGNIQNRSRWWADCRPAWVIFDLAKEEEISGFGWGSYNAIDYIPRDYSYQISSDGKSWKTVLRILSNTSSDRLDRLSHPVSARYVRFYVDETVKRGMLVLNEFSVIPGKDDRIFSSFDHYRTLMTGMYNFWTSLNDAQINDLKGKSDLVAWIPFSWKTQPQNVVSPDEQRYYIPMWVDSISHEYTFELPESELYSSPGQFLQRKVDFLSFDMPFTSEGVSINSLIWKPLFPSQ